MGYNPPFHPFPRQSQAAPAQQTKTHHHHHRCSSSPCSHIKIALQRNSSLFRNSARQRQTFPISKHQPKPTCNGWIGFTQTQLNIKTPCFLRLIVVCWGSRHLLLLLLQMLLLPIMTCPLQLLSTGPAFSSC